MAKRSAGHNINLVYLRSGGKPADPFDLQRFIAARAPVFASEEQLEPGAAHERGRPLRAMNSEGLRRPLTSCVV